MRTILLTLCLTASAFVAGCTSGSNDDAIPSSTGEPTSQAAPTLPPDFPSSVQDMATPPTALPLASPGTPAGTPDPLPSHPTEARVEGFANGPITAAGAESFAVSFAQFQVAIEVERDQRAFLETNTSKEMDDDVRDYMYEQFEMARFLGEGQFDTTLPVIIRSEITGPIAAPTKVIVEVVGSIGETSTGLDFGYPSIGMQVGVKHEDGAWRVIDYSVFRPSNAPIPWDRNAPTVKTILNWVVNEPGWIPLPPSN